MEDVSTLSSRGASALRLMGRTAGWVIACVGITLGVMGFIAGVEGGLPLCVGLTIASIILLPPISDQLRGTLAVVRPSWMLPLTSAVIVIVSAFASAPNVPPEARRGAEDRSATSKATAPTPQARTLSRAAAPPATVEDDFPTTSDFVSSLAVTRKLLEPRLRDPDGARIVDLRLYRTGKRLTLCGLFNAKNGFGGYSGSEPFILSDDGVFVGEGEATVGRLASMCTGTRSGAAPAQLLR